MGKTCAAHCLESLQKFSDWGPLLLRIIVGFLFMMHGIGKLWNVGGMGGGMEGTIIFFASYGFPAFFAYLVAWIEFLGGIAIIVGIATRYMAVLGTIILLVAIFSVKSGMFATKGIGAAEVDLLYIGAFLSLLFTGAGKYSLDALCSCGAKKTAKK